MEFPWKKNMAPELAKNFALATPFSLQKICLSWFLRYLKFLDFWAFAPAPLVFPARN